MILSDGDMKLVLEVSRLLEEIGIKPLLKRRG